MKKNSYRRACASQKLPYKLVSYITFYSYKKRLIFFDTSRILNIKSQTLFSTLAKDFICKIFLVCICCKPLCASYSIFGNKQKIQLTPLYFYWNNIEASYNWCYLCFS